MIVQIDRSQYNRSVSLHRLQSVNVRTDDVQRIAIGFQTFQCTVYTRKVPKSTVYSPSRIFFDGEDLYCRRASLLSSQISYQFLCGFHTVGYLGKFMPWGLWLHIQCILYTLSGLSLSSSSSLARQRFHLIKSFAFSGARPDCSIPHSANGPRLQCKLCIQLWGDFYDLEFREKIQTLNQSWLLFVVSNDHLSESNS